MLYAKVVVGLPVAGPFDYAVEPALEQKIKPGCRAWVPWRNQKKLGYVVGLTKKTNIRQVKSITSLIDELPVLDKNMLLLTRKLSDYYCCSWGEAIETALPQALRKGRTLPPAHINSTQDIPALKQRNLLIHDLEGTRRWDIYLKEIKETLSKNKSALLLFPDKKAVLRAREIISSKISASMSVLCRHDSKGLEEWLKIKQGKVNIVIGTRSSIFAPAPNLKLVIIDEEHDPSYKQDQVPHYHPREVALMRIKLERSKLILGSASVSLESFYLAKKLQMRYLRIEREKRFPDIKIIDIRHRPDSERRASTILSKYLQDAVALSLNSNEKVLLFLNRKGFATVASCVSCGLSLKCPRCSVNLIYYFKDSLLKCHYCNFKMQPPSLCPHCNAGYIKYSGVGTEKIESELSRIFPQARIKMLDRQKYEDITEADIFISTQGIVRDADYNFDLIGILSIDNSLNRVDFRAGEKTFQLLTGILRLTDKKVIIQTGLAKSHIFTALLNQDAEIFYRKELDERRQLNFPPYQHLGLVKIRGKKEEKVKEIAQVLFRRLNQAKAAKNIKIISVNCAQPAKLRGNFYWQILTRARSAFNLSKFLKIHLKDLAHSGIIITVDIDPL
jgi:primosomal protein N' (replication factor Y)